MNDSSPWPRQNPTQAAWWLIAWFGLTGGMVLLIAAFHPWGKNVSSNELLPTFSAIMVESYVPLLPCVAIVLIGTYQRWKRLWAVGQWAMVVWPILVMTALIAKVWSGHSLFSRTTIDLLFQHTDELLRFASPGMLIACSLSLFLVFVVLWLARRILMTSGDAPSWSTTQPWVMWSTIVFGFVLSFVGMVGFSSRTTLAATPLRSPWYLLGWRTFEPTATPTPVAMDWNGVVQKRLQQNRFNVVVQSIDAASHRPDVLIVVIESLRPELIAPDVIPNVYEMTKRGVWMKRHHSGGNASSLGIFSLVSGLEAVWFYLAEIRFSPAMNRLFRQAGYELGFFAGADDWDDFQMDAFINADAYDVFEIEPRNWLASDRRAITRAESFFERPEGEASASRTPRLAMLYLYSTHAPFDVDESFVTNRPAASANYPIPFTPAMRPAIWNRYRNAARSIDHLIAGLIADPSRITVVVGDHGESFLDDGTIGHGTRCSATQIQTPAILAGPGVVPRVISDATCHADLLPTILAAAGIAVTCPECFDGVDVLSRNGDQERVISVADYLREQVLLIPSPPPSRSQPFGWQCELSLRTGHAAVLGPVRPNGDPLGVSTQNGHTDRGNPGVDLLNAWLGKLSR